VVRAGSKAGNFRGSTEGNAFAKKKRYIYTRTHTRTHTHTHIHARAFLSDYDKDKSFEIFRRKTFYPVTGRRVRAKYVYVFGNDCTFVITAVGALFYCSTVSVNRKYARNVGRREKTQSGETKREIRSYLSPPPSLAHVDFDRLVQVHSN